MAFWHRLKNNKNRRAVVKMAQMVDMQYYAWDGKIYSSDIVRSCIAPKQKTIGKLLAMHIRRKEVDGKKDTQVNPDAYMRFLLEEPNPYMSGQKLQEQLAAQLAINRNAFALIVRDDNGLPQQIYPIPAAAAEAIYDDSGQLYIRFTTTGGEQYTFAYSNIIHIQEDMDGQSIFGRSIMPALAPLMDVVTTTDQGIVHAIKNGSVIRWLLKFSSSLRAEDIKAQTEEYAKNFLSIENGSGVAGVDARADAKQITPQQYIPEADQMGATRDRIYALFNTNKDIVTSNWDERQWGAYFEAEIEPVMIALENEYTRKLFTRRERGCGNKIEFDASRINSELTSTKLAFKEMVDRKSLSPNEWREKFHYAPTPGGDEMIFWQDPKGIGSGSQNEKEG